MSFSKANKLDFIDYIDKFGGTDVFFFGNRLSFGGSDGPKVKEWGFKDGEQYFYTNPESIDEYIKGCCEDGYNSPLLTPKITFTEYLQNKYGLQ